MPVHLCVKRLILFRSLMDRSMGFVLFCNKNVLFKQFTFRLRRSVMNQCDLYAVGLEARGNKPNSFRVDRFEV
jgi:hypothetical protein